MSMLPKEKVLAVRLQLAMAEWPVDARENMIGWVKDALQEQREACMHWQPIETAPHNTHVLVLLADGAVCSARRYAVNETGDLHWISHADRHGDDFIERRREPKKNAQHKEWTSQRA